MRRDSIGVGKEGLYSCVVRCGLVRYDDAPSSKEKTRLD